ncbi:Dbl homology domain-containing protein [Suillus occidentalis]|nr:Dbl homology domain-containing protein [Suillus occidentalis]
MSSVAHEFLHSDRTNGHRDHRGFSGDNNASWEDFRHYILERFGEVEVRRQEIVWRLAESEATFVINLQNMVQLFILPLRVRSTKVWVSGVPDDVSRLFDWLEDIVHLHTKLSASLAGLRDVHNPNLQCVGETLQPFMAKLEIYQPYLVKLEFVATRIEHLVAQEKSDIGDFIKLQERSSACQGWSLEKYLVEPVQRLSQYPDFFHRLWHATPKSHPDYLSTLSVLHSAKLTIRVLSEVKDREDEYEFLKDMFSRIANVPCQLPCRDRRLLMHGLVACAKVENGDDLPVMRASTNVHGLSEPLKSPSPARHNERLSNALKGWRGRSGSVQSTASTAVSLQSFRTAPSSFDFRSEPQAGPRNSPLLRVESPAVDVQLFVFTDLIMMASATNHRDESKRASANLHILDDFGLSRILSVTDETGSLKDSDDRRSSISLDLVPLTAEELERGYANSKGRVLTVSLSHGTSRSSVSEASMQCAVLKDWLVPLRQCCQHALRSLSSPSGKNHLAHASKESEISQSVLSILASGLPFPKSPSMQLHGVELGQAGDAEQQEREERGWWSLRFHEVLREIQGQEVVLPR